MNGVVLGLLLAASGSVTVGSKTFTESVILGELATRVVREAGFPAEHRREIGGSRVLFEALVRGDVDVYPEYTGTLRQELLAGEDVDTDAQLRDALARRGLEMSRPLGFANDYAIGLRRERAKALGVKRLSDLARHPSLAFGFSNEFMSRRDGWPGLRAAYGLPQTDVRGLDHDLALRALEAGEIDATDLYTTDAEIAVLDLATLEDDRRFFPSYEAVLLWRRDLSQNVKEALRALEGRVDAETMSGLNARVKIEREPESEVASSFLSTALGLESKVVTEGRLARVGRRTLEHLALVAISLSAGIVVAVPLGIVAARRRRLGRFVLAGVGLLQTIPSLALLVVMIPLLGIGAAPAIAALFLYALLPIVRNTVAGLEGIAPELVDSAQALGLPSFARLRLVELPLALPSMLAGIKTAAVIDVGTATLGALVGAGGLGQPILTGIRLADTGLILEGAVPAAALALVVQGAFDLVERGLVPRGLRRGRA